MIGNQPSLLSWRAAGGVGRVAASGFGQRQRLDDLSFVFRVEFLTQIVCRSRSTPGILAGVAVSRRAIG